MPWIDINQNTDEWLDLRMGKVTGSTIGKIMANFGRAFGEPAKKLAVNIGVEQISGIRQGDEYTNANMERGHIEEPIARQFYEEQYFVEVTNGGFYDNGKTGCSPDGRVGADGLVEIKSAIATMHYDRIKRGSYDPQYKWQFIFNLKESGRDWIDFISYCSSYPPKTKLFVYRLEKEKLKKEYQMIDDRLGEFFEMLKTVKERIKNG